MQPSVYIEYDPNGQSKGMLVYGEGQVSVTLSFKIRKEKSGLVIQYFDESDTGRIMVSLIIKNVQRITEEYERLAAEYQAYGIPAILAAPVFRNKGGHWEEIKTEFVASPRKDSRNVIKVCVDEKRADIEGRIYTMYSKRPVVFYSLNKMLLWIDRFLDFLSYPIAAIQTIGFQDKKVRDTGKGLNEMPKFELSNETGKSATFIIKVLVGAIHESPVPPVCTYPVEAIIKLFLG